MKITIFKQSPTFNFLELENNYQKINQSKKTLLIIYLIYVMFNFKVPSNDRKTIFHCQHNTR